MDTYSCNHTHSISVSDHNHGGFVHDSFVGGITTNSVNSIWANAKVISTNIKENENMETLYQVTVVTKKKEIILDKKLIAVDIENAKFVSGLYGVLAENDLTPAEVTVLVATLGSVKVEKESK